MMIFRLQFLIWMLHILHVGLKPLNERHSKNANMYDIGYFFITVIISYNILLIHIYNITAEYRHE